jgi:lipopolysaccharide export system protein LptA
MMLMGRKIILVTAVAASVGVAGLAAAQEPVSALRGLNSNAPVDISSDRIEVQERSDRAIFAGNVVARQDRLTLETARLTVAYSTQGGIDIDRLDAAGGVVVRSPSETARGNFGIYDLDRKLITLIGDVQLTRENNQVNGQRLVIDLNTGRAVIDGGSPGVAQSGGRVTGRFTVPQRRNGS